MLSLLLALLLQAPDDLAAFLAALEKDRQKGATNEALLKKIDEWSAGKPEEALARIAWNRGLIESTGRIDALFVEGLRKRVGQQVTLGRSTGVVKEVKPDRVTLGVPGGTVDLEFASIAYDVRLDDVKKQGLLPAASAEEAVFRFAAGKSAASLAAANALSGEAKDRALAAAAGWVLQEADRAFATGVPLKAAEDFASSWAKHADLMNASDGALRKYADGTLAPKLVDQADAILAKDRKEARKYLDVAASLGRSAEVVQKISERRWAVIEKNEWMRLPLESAGARGGEVDGSKIVCEDEDKSEKAAVVEFASLPVGWGEISGFRARVKVGTAVNVSVRIGLDHPSAYHSINFQAAEPLVYHGFYADRGDKATLSGAKKIAKKAEYEFRAERTGNRWRFGVDSVDVYTGDGSDPSILFFVIGDGKSEILSLEVRKK